MDGSAFDRLARIFTTSRSRRGLSRLLGGLAVGGPLALVGFTESAAKKKKKVTLCHQGQTMSVSKKAKKKHLKHGDTLGECSTTTPPPPDPCGSVICGAIPNGTSKCAAGVCVVDSCENGFRDCRGGVDDGCETNVTGNLQHCGACDRACPGQGEANTTARCISGKCEQVRTYTTVGTAFFTVPAAGTITVEALGASGGRGGRGADSGSSSATGGAGGSGGPGGRVTASFAVVAGDVLQINVGGQGGAASNGAVATPGQGGTAGVNGGAVGGSGGEVNGPDGGGGGGGGGASDVRHGAFALNDRILSAFGGGGGGGGAGADSVFEERGGAGGAGGTGGGNTGGGPGGPSNTGNGNGVPGGSGSPGTGFGPAGANVISGVHSGNGRVTLTFLEA